MAGQIALPTRSCRRKDEVGGSCEHEVGPEDDRIAEDSNWRLGITDDEHLPARIGYFEWHELISRRSPSPDCWRTLRTPGLALRDTQNLLLCIVSYGAACDNSFQMRRNSLNLSDTLTMIRGFGESEIKHENSESGQPSL
jgi:hypothetical protein